MSKFEVGDKVKNVTHGGYTNCEIGQIGTVKRVGTAAHCYVTFTHVYNDATKRCCYCWLDDELELIEDTKVNRLAGMKLKFDVTDNPELSEAIQKRLFELGAEVSHDHSYPIITVGISGLSYDTMDGNVTLWPKGRDSDMRSCTPATLDDLYHLPKARTITLEDGRQVELSEELYRQFEDVAK